MADWEKESQNFFRLVKLIDDVGSSVLRDVLLNVLAPDTLDNILQRNIHKKITFIMIDPKFCLIMSSVF